MTMLKSRKYVVALGIAVAAFVATFYLAYAGAVQWSREQPATVKVIPAVALSDTAITLYTDSKFTQELTPGGLIVFRQLRFLPPLDKFLAPTQVRATIWGKNNSEIPLSLVGFCCQEIRDPDTNAFLGYYGVGTSSWEPVQPGQTRAFWFIDIQNIQPGLAGKEFSVILGATGEIVDGSSSLSLELEQVLKDAAAQSK
ncbi:MAG: hypothetical protein HYU30_00465 [Chloroflexi bacterium]|nr:hypothetical protein [Chloroflexota bacterium]